MLTGFRIDQCRASDRATQDVPQWYVDYFALKATKTPQAQEKPALLPFNYLEEFKLRAWPMTRVITRNYFVPLYMAGQTTNSGTCDLPTGTV